MSLRALYIQYILLALAVGAAAFPVPGIMSPVHKDPLVKGPSNLLFSFFHFASLFYSTRR